MSSSAHSDDAPKLRLSLRADSRIADPYPTVLRPSGTQAIPRTISRASSAFGPGLSWGPHGDQEKLEAEARARQLAEQQAREAAALECRRLEQERLDGRAVRENFANYGKDEEFKGIGGRINAFLKEPRKAKPCR